MPEHDVFDNVIVFGAKRAALFTGSNYPTTGDYFLYCNSQTGLEFTTTIHQVQISTLAVEHYNPAGGYMMPAFEETTTDIVDPSILARGRVGRYVVKGGVGYDTTFTQTGAFYLSTPRLRDDAFTDTIATRDSDQSIPNATLTVVDFNAETDDFNDAHSNVTNPSRITPAKYGTATLIANIQFAANATGVRGVQIWKHVGGSSDYKIAGQNMDAVSNSDPTIITVSAITMAASPGDYFYEKVYQNSGAALALTYTGGSTDVSSQKFAMRY